MSAGHLEQARAAFLQGLHTLEAGDWLPHVPDTGRGTGPCGAHVRSRAGHLSGVDTSPAMVDKARQRSVYDTLQVADSSAR